MSVIGAAAIGAGISALGGLLSSSLSNSANASMDRETRDWQEYMYNKNNAYNTPVNQRARLEAAGINPALAFQNGNTGVASSAPSAVQHTPADFSALGSGLAQAGQMALQAQNIDAQNDLIRSQAEAQKIDNINLQARKIAEWENLKADLKKKNADTSWLDWQEKRDMALFDAYQKKAYAEINQINQQSALAEAETALSVGRNQREQQQLSSVIAQLQAAANSSNAAAALAHAQRGIIPNLSASQRDQLATAFVNEALKRASAEEIAGFKFSGATVEKLKQAVLNFLLGD